MSRGLDHTSHLTLQNGSFGTIKLGKVNRFNINNIILHHLSIQFLSYTLVNRSFKNNCPDNNNEVLKEKYIKRKGFY